MTKITSNLTGQEYTSADKLARAAETNARAFPSLRRQYLKHAAFWWEQYKFECGIQKEREYADMRIAEISAWLEG